MDSYTITPPSRLKYLRWLGYLGIILAAAYVYLAIESYQENGWGFVTIVNVICVVAWLAITYTNVNSAIAVEEVILSPDEITFIKNNKKKLISWDKIASVNMTNNALFLTLDNQRQEELNIGYLEYKQLQKAKKKLHAFCDEKEIPFSTKY